MKAVGENYERALHRALREIAYDVFKEPIDRNTAIWKSSVHPHSAEPYRAVGPWYWSQNLELPVLFSSAVETLLDESKPELDMFIEVGPHPALRGPLKQIWARRESQSAQSLPPYLATLNRGEDALRSVLTLAGNLFISNVPIDLSTVNATDLDADGHEQPLTRGSLCVEMPKYIYKYGPILYHENRLNRELRLRKHLRHDILGARLPGCAKGHPAWRNVLRPKDVPWLKDHQVSLQLASGNHR